MFFFLLGRVSCLLFLTQKKNQVDWSYMLFLQDERGNGMLRRTSTMVPLPFVAFVVIHRPHHFLRPPSLSNILLEFPTEKESKDPLLRALPLSEDLPNEVRCSKVNLCPRRDARTALLFLEIHVYEHCSQQATVPGMQLLGSLPLPAPTASTSAGYRNCPETNMAPFMPFRVILVIE